jgi:hypothetical protein
MPSFRNKAELPAEQAQESKTLEVVRVSKVAFLFASNEYADATLLCPWCGGTYTHLDNVYVVGRPNGEDGPVVLARVDSGANLTHEQAVPIPDFGRRHVFSIVGWCEECDGRFAIEFMQHKGETQLAIRNLGESGARS